MKHFITFFSTGCYTGFLPLAPGTWGSLVGVGLFWLLRTLPPSIYLVTVIAFIVFAIWIADKAQIIFDETDPSKVTIDEIAGILVTMAFHRPEIIVVVMGFVLFRIFDVIKPWPIRWAERRFSNGLGVVLDDVMAGVFASAALFILEIIIY